MITLITPHMIARPFDASRIESTMLAVSDALSATAFRHALTERRSRLTTCQDHLRAEVAELEAREATHRAACEIEQAAADAHAAGSDRPDRVIALRDALDIAAGRVRFEARRVREAHGAVEQALDECDREIAEAAA